VPNTPADAMRRQKRVIPPADQQGQDEENDDDFDVVAPIEPHVQEQDLISTRCIPLLSDDCVKAVDGSPRHMIARHTVCGTLHGDRSGDSDCSERPAEDAWWMCKQYLKQFYPACCDDMLDDKTGLN
jgi:hypothetical protein